MAQDAKAFREMNLNESRFLDPCASSNAAAAITAQQRGPATTSDGKLDIAKLTPKNLKKMLAQKYQEEENKKNQDDDSDDDGVPKQDQGPSGTIDVQQTEFVKSFTYSGKRIAVPVRVEPKVNFALERTLLAWVEFSVLLSAIGVGLLNFTGKNDTTGFAAAITFTIIALLVIAYSAVIFLYRAIAIRRRLAIAYDDRYGPTALVVVLITATSVNFALRIAEAF